MSHCGGGTGPGDAPDQMLDALKAFSEKTGKPFLVVLHPAHEMEYVGSVQAKFNERQLPVFQSFERAAAALEILPVPGLPEFRPGDDVAAAIAAAAPWLRDDDVVVVTSKVLSKSEGRIVAAHLMEILLKRN